MDLLAASSVVIYRQICAWILRSVCWKIPKDFEFAFYWAPQYMLLQYSV